MYLTIFQTLIIKAQTILPYIITRKGSHLLTT